MVFFLFKIDKIIVIFFKKYDLDKKFFKEILFLIEFFLFYNYVVFFIEIILFIGVDLLFL